MEIKYPVRCRIIDITDKNYGVGSFPAKTPDISKPHIGKEGMALRDENDFVRIDLDDGNTIYGCECWWEPLVEV